MSGEVVDVGEEPRGRDESPIVCTPLEDEDGLRFVDRVERRQYKIRTPTPVFPKPTDPERFQVPVDIGVRVVTEEIELPQRESVHVRDDSGHPVIHTFDTDRSCPAGRYLVDITTSVKLYLHVDSELSINPTPSSTKIGFDGPTDVVIGVRSPHRQPNGKITTTDRFDDLRSTVSLLSSALKTTSPERSYPTLRGHPPLVELGDDHSVPDHLIRPETGVVIEVNQSLEDLLVASPLAFYLGAEMRWGDRRLLTEDGFVWPLANAIDFETGVERVLKQSFLMDCITRTEGLHQVELDERQLFEERTGTRFDFARLYEQPLKQRLKTYLSVPYDTVSDLVPTWSASTYVEPTLDSFTYLPYLIDLLTTISVGHQSRFTDHPEQGLPRIESAQGSNRSVESASRLAESSSHLLLPEAESAVTNIWVGEGIPIGTSKALAAGFEHRLDRPPRTGDIRIQVVCNEPEMSEERDSVHDIYHARTDYPYTVDIETDVSTEHLRAILETETDFFHYIGHVDQQGFRCRDGWLSVEDCGDVEADIFLLNSCRSLEEGEMLVRNGSIAGIVTLTDLLNHRAAAIGRTMAMFVNHGFPMYAVHDVVRQSHSFGDAYTLLGDAHTVLFQPTTTFPEYLELQSRLEDRYQTLHKTFPSHRTGIGTDICPSYEDGDLHYLLGGKIATVELSLDELEQLVELPMPLRIGEELCFSVTDENRVEI